LAQFVRELAHVMLGFPEMDDPTVIIAVLRLVDLVLVANLLVMIVGAGVEMFLPSAVHKEEAEAEIDIVDIATLKLRFFASISAIAAIDLLESFVNISSVDKTVVLWEIAILLTFVASGVLLALMERLSSEPH